MRTGMLMLLALLGAGCEPEGGESADAACSYACPLEADEDCDACAERIATCCYGEGGPYAALVPQVMDVCAADPGCRACCTECGAMTCEELIERDGCPVDAEVE